MFQFVRLTTNDSGAVSALIEYDLQDGKLHRVEELYVNKNVAVEWVINVLQEYLYKKLKRWIDHKVILSSVSHAWSTPLDRESKLRTLENFKREVPKIAECPPDFICLFIINGEDLLRSLLPLKTQESYKSSVEGLDDLIAFSKEYISTIKIRKHETTISS